MNDLAREDNKKLLLIFDIIFLLLITTSLVINLINLKNIVAQYIILASALCFFAIYLISYSIVVRRSMTAIKLEDNNLAFYASSYTKNRNLKRTISVLDIISILLMLASTGYYFYIIKFIDVYHEYPLMVVLLVVVLEVYILIKDIRKINKLDRIDAHNSNNDFSIMDKKLIIALYLLCFIASNIAMLSFTKPHFVVHFYDMVIYEMIAFSSIVSLFITLFINKIYYYHYNLVQIEQTTFNTKFLEKIGEGSYATVYKAYVPSLKTIYAVKKLDSTDVVAIERFKEEYKIMSNLKHTNLLSVYSIDEIKYEYIMDYCQCTLYEYMQEHTLTEDVKKSLVMQLLDGFKYLHQHQILHRDISYNNIMLIENEAYNELVLKVMDFGIAKNNKESKHYTKTKDQITGSIFDMTLKNFKDYNEQNDIYGLGFIINYIYTNSDSILNDDSNISKLILKCMHMDLSQRYKNVSEIITDFKEVM